MKKTFILAVMTALIGSFTVNAVQAAYTPQESKEIIQTAISKYKQKNYLGCISDLKLYNEQNPSSAVVWYYLGSSYMNIAMKDDARNAFAKVISLNTVPQLTSYAIQANLCMDDVTKCNYQNFTVDEIQKLRSNPHGFFESLLNAGNAEPEIKDENVMEIDKLIDGTYSGNIHPDAKAFIDQERIKMQQSKMNASRLNALKSNPSQQQPAAKS
ncbi:MAG: hypothetical protein ACI37R_06715 [Candidatus Avigastranaerophilus sp.]